MPHLEKAAVTGLARWLQRAENAKWLRPENWAQAPQQLRRAIEAMPDSRVMQVGRQPLNTTGSEARAFAAMGNQGPEVVKRLNGATEQLRLRKLLEGYEHVTPSKVVRESSNVGPIIRQERLRPLGAIDPHRASMDARVVSEAVENLPQSTQEFLAAYLQRMRKADGALVLPPFTRGRHAFLPADTHLNNLGVNRQGVVQSFDPMLTRLVPVTSRKSGNPATLLQTLTGRRGFQPDPQISGSGGYTTPVSHDFLRKNYSRGSGPSGAAEIQGRPRATIFPADDLEKTSATLRGKMGLLGLLGTGLAGAAGGGLYLGGDYKGDTDVSRLDYLKTRAALGQAMARLRTDKGWMSDVEMDTGLHRIVMPKSWIDEKALKYMPEGREWVKTIIAIPEKGQDTPFTWRQRGTGGHLHRHPNSWVMHRDRHQAMTMKLKDAKNLKDVVSAVGEGSKHILAEGVPGAINFIDTMTTGGPSIPARAGLGGPNEEQWGKNVVRKVDPR